MSRAAVLLVLALAGCATAAVPPTPAPPAATGPPAPTAASGEPAPVVPGPASSQARELAQADMARGQAALARGEMAVAAADLREALRRQPDLVEARAALGVALHALGDLDGAVEELRATLRRQPEAADVRLALARALVARQDWPAAREELERVLAVRPEQADARYALGIVRYAQGDTAGAIEAYRRVLTAQPGQPDARFNLALVLKLARREAEATPEFVAAAEAGHARAQYFAGAAYAAGLGVERSLGTALAWWFRAAEQGVVQAHDALAQQRQVALGRSRRPPAERRVAEQAFADYRASLWREFPDLVPGNDESVGGALLAQGRAGEAVPVLIREASALSQPALRLLETLNEQGAERDPRIQAYLTRAAAEGLRAPTP